MTEVIRPTYGRLLTVVVGVLAVLMVVIAGIQGGWEDAARTLPWALLLGGGCWAAFWRPRVEVSDAGVRVVNVTRTIDVPWPALQGVETRWALTLDTAYGRVTAWSAPAPSARPGLRSLAAARREGQRGVIAPPASSDDVATPSGSAAAVVRDRWEALRAAGHLESPQLEHVTAPVHWHWETFAIGALLLVLGIVTLY